MYINRRHLKITLERSRLIRDHSKTRLAINETLYASNFLQQVNLSLARDNHVINSHHLLAFRSLFILNVFYKL